MIRLALTRALMILAVAGLITLAGWLNVHDRQVERASLEAYCGSVAQWQAEESRGIAAERRTGHPDYHDKAAEACPGMRPAGPAIINERQLARN